MNYLRNSINYLLWATTLTPLVVINVFPFPHGFGKTFFFRVVVEILTILFLAYLVWSKDSAIFGRLKALLKNPLFIAVLVFFFSAAVSTVFAHNSYHAFWGNAERGDGLFNLLHYLVLLIVAISVFEKKDWFLFFKISLGVSLVVVFYAWLQYFDISNFPFALKVNRLGSFFDNAAFFGTYLIFITGLSGLVFHEAKSRFWRYSSIFIILFSVPQIFIVRVRGPVVGLAAGLLFLLLYFVFRGGKEAVAATKIRKISLTALGLLAVFGVTFFFTRGADFWQTIPGFNRFTDISLSDSSFQTRLIALGSSWEAFMEKPIIGWGLENYNVGYNKYYNPKYATYEEAWFDRAHNKVMEVAVIQGGLGLISYLSMFAVLFFLLFKKEKSLISADQKLINADKKIRIDQSKSVSNGEAPILGALVIAYFVQNLFLFDTPVSYLMLFVVLGFIVSGTLMVVDNKPIVTLGGRKKLEGLGFGAIFLVITGFIFYSLYSYHFIPYRQYGIYRKALNTGVGTNVLEAAPEMFDRYNYIQPTLRYQLLEVVFNNGVLRNTEFNPLNDLALRGMEEVIEREWDYDPRNHLLLAESYNERAKSDPVFLKRGEEVLKQAFKLSPRRQDVYYVLAFNLAAQGRFDEAIKLNRENIALNPSIAKPHYNLGISLTLAGQGYWEEAEQEFRRALDIGFIDPDTIKGDFNNISVALESMLSVYILNHDKEKTIRVAEMLRDVSRRIGSALGDDMDIIIDYAEREDWDTLIEAITTNSPE